ncbi:hypothetical protein LEA_20037, partial [human gut metagenome]
PLPPDSKKNLPSPSSDWLCCREDFGNHFLINTLKTKIIMRLIYNDALNKRIAPYLERLTKKRTSLDKETMTLLDVFMQYFNMDTRYGTYSDKLEPCIIHIIQEEKIKSVANLFDGKLNKVLRYLLGDEYANLFHTYLKLKARCPYTHGYSRRSQRSANPLLHFSHIIDALTEFLKL